ncbi:glutathione S-transferase family protein [Pararhizobium mangrovi]|uniref:Glutathione S-transferase family protein n=1 Tax=Pararhizobium mangrovi TaxID=2590452 RepID=A0A506UHT1_9HYPH|nr:glutathione S-transferase family protein [Pararhizobium mangrovi]TPW32863.1 glutathione S-transferase family protein [Pararhizobium mangrovi]
MGKLVDGVWHDVWYDTESNKGHFKRESAGFRNWITPDGSAGPSGEGGFEAEAGRYHLYVSYACPWAHRALIFRTLKKLEKAIDVSVVDYFMGENGWAFVGRDGGTLDPVNGADFLHQIYTKADPHYTGRVTVPTLWDKKRGTIVSNESADIIRMFNSAFTELSAGTPDYDPPELHEEIEAVNERVYHTVNNGVYKTGFATEQDAYEEHFLELFDTLDWLEDRLSRQRYVAGDRITEADWRLFTTLVRFDPVYFGHFKCNRRRLVDYENLWAYARELYQVPGVKETVDFRHIKNHYYMSHPMVNPTRIVPLGPEIDFEAPHGRETMRAAA